MSFLRRRFGGGGADDSDISTPELSREPSPGRDGKRPANLRLITAEQLQTLKQKGKHKKRRNVWVFGLGGLFGLLLAGFFASSNDMIDLTSLEGVNLESIMEALPDNFVRSAQQLQVRGVSASYAKGLDNRTYKSRGIEADFPNPVENRTRRRELRFFRRRSPRAETRHKSQTSRYNDSRRHLHGS
jgi:phospholipid:diacylglycerol acyltransferase